MTTDRPPLFTWEAPAASEIGETVEDFLRRLGGSAWLIFPGRDRTRTRAVSTLLHGNEPSGVRAVFEWIRSGRQPAVNLVCFIGAVNAALAPPGFFYRVLPGHRDLNRCFREPFEGPEGSVAAEVLRRLRAARPEVLLDIHNTSGLSPSYAVSTRYSPAHKAITTLFSRHLILTDLRLGTLLEATEDEFPTVTVECGGVHDPQSTTLAVQGLFRYAAADSVLDLGDTDSGVTLLKHPIRVELGDGARVAYAAEPVPGADLTFRPDVDLHNFGVVPSGQVLGWVGPRGLSSLHARDAQGNNRIGDVFTERDGTLVVTQPTRFFMITTNPMIARSDCLFYAIPSGEAAPDG